MLSPTQMYPDAQTVEYMIRVCGCGERCVRSESLESSRGGVSLAVRVSGELCALVARRATRTAITLC
eukprot:6964034-Prymnesium_polylepis.1